MTVFNRRELTRASLTALREVARRLAPGFEFRVFVVDDGSTDGTGAVLEREFEEVIVARGDGQLFWAGGMQRAFVASRLVSEDFDAYLLVNDDVKIEPEAASRMLVEWSRSESPIILVGATVGSDGNEVTYAGFDLKPYGGPFDLERALPTRGILTPCDTFNANFVVVPGDFMRNVNGLDPAYTHGLADLDLGLVARRAGVPAHVYGYPIGTCDRGRPTNEILASKSFTMRARMLFVHPYGPRPYIHFVRKHHLTRAVPLYAGWMLVKRVRALFAPMTFC